MVENNQLGSSLGVGVSLRGYTALLFPYRGEKEGWIDQKQKLLLPFPAKNESKKTNPRHKKQNQNTSSIWGTHGKKG